MRARDWHTRVVFNQSHKLRFEFKYRNVDFPEGLQYAFVPPAEKSLEECGSRGLPAALLELQTADRRPSRFTSGYVAVDCLIDRLLKGEMRDSCGRPL